LAEVHAADRLFADGRTEEAVVAYLAIPPSAGEWHAYGAWRAGVIYRDALHDDDRAQTALQECAKAHAESDWGYACLVDLGDLRRETHRPRPAIDAYRRALDIRPTGSYSEHCLFNSGLSYLSLGEPEQARVEWKELIDRYPKSVFAASVALEKARSHDLDGDHKTSLKEFREVKGAWPHHSVAPLAAFGEAESLEQLGRFDEAEKAYVEVLAIHPNPAAVMLRIERLKLRGLRRERPETYQPDRRRRR
jgi:tetratricopeptide (TPR) repeat protein